MTEINIEFDKTTENSEDSESTVEKDKNQDNSEHLELLQRLKAEFDNYRKRTEKEKQELSKFVEGNLIQKIIPILDDLERLLQSGSQDNSLMEGCRLIYENINSILNELGLEAFTKVGDMFDPGKHDAIAVHKASEEFNNKIMSISQKGYIFNNRILRHAKVEVGQYDKVMSKK